MKNLHQNIKIKITIIFFVILMFMLIFIKLHNLTNKSKIEERQMGELFSVVETNSYANITKYFIYGTHLNCEGNIDIINISGIKIESVNLVLKSIEGEELRNKGRLQLFR